MTPEEVETYEGRKLDGILTYIDKLNELDVTNVEPMAQGLAKQVEAAGAGGRSHPELREDILCPAAVADAILSQAPDAEKPFFRVPKVIER